MYAVHWTQDPTQTADHTQRVSKVLCSLRLAMRLAKDNNSDNAQVGSSRYLFTSAS